MPAQLGVLLFFDPPAFAGWLNLYPDAFHIVEVPPDAPEYRRALEGIGQATLDRLDVRILRTVVFHDPRAAFRIVQTDAADLRLVLPEHKLVCPVHCANRIVQALLYRAAVKIGDRHALRLVLVRDLHFPVDILIGERAFQFFQNFFYIHKIHAPSVCIVMHFPAGYGRCAAGRGCRFRSAASAMRFCSAPI